MANIKFSQFTNQAAADTTYLVGFDGTDNTNYTKAQIKTWLTSGSNAIPTLYSENGTLADNRTITMNGNTLSMSSPGGNTVTFGGANNSGMAITGGNNYIVSFNGTYAISSIATSTSDAIVLRTSANASADTSILIDSRSPGASADLHLKTATKLKIDLPVTATVGYVLKADDTAGNVSWGAETDTGVTGVTLTTGTGQTSPLAESITSRELTITSNKYGGTNQVGYVPEGGTNTTFLRGDGTWVTPTDSTDNAAGSAGQLQYTTGSGVFAATSDMVYTTDQLKIQNSIYLDGNGPAGGGSGNAGIVKLGCEAAGASHYVGLEGPNHSGNTQYNIKFPDATPSANKMLIVNSMASTTANMVWRDMYDANGSLTGARIVTMGSHNLSFASTTAGQEVKFGQNVRIDGQSYTPLETISSTTSWTPDWDNGNVQTMELTGTTTINNPSNIEVGATYIIILKQDTEGSHTVTWGNAYNFPASTPPTLTTGAGKADVITLVAYSSTVLMCTSVLDFETT